MARITVEDCLKRIPNRFELVTVAAKRARQLETGEASPTLPWENDKSTVVALREIAEGKVGVNILDSSEPRQNIIATHENHNGLGETGDEAV